MSTWTLRHDGIGAGLLALLHRRRPARLAPPAANVAPAAARSVSDRRAEAMRGFFPKLASWYERQAYQAEMRSVDRYLSQSTDLGDLERRIRAVERGGTAARLY